MDRSVSKKVKPVEIKEEELPLNPTDYDVFKVSLIKIIIAIFLYTVAIAWGGFFRVLTEHLYQEKDTVRVALTYAFGVSVVAILIVYKWNRITGK